MVCRKLKRPESNGAGPGNKKQNEEARYLWKHIQLIELQIQ